MLLERFYRFFVESDAENGTNMSQNPAPQKVKVYGNRKRIGAPAPQEIRW
ncbi:MAG TPA: hypothetical protein VN040_01105 [Pseudosphingobacterium sp.]|nr:hypothetical protein [Pseudosphingobacterium sp.]